MTGSNKEVFTIIVKMVLISVIASALLGITYVPTQKQLKINYEEMRKEALTEIMPDASDFDTVFGETIIDEDGDREILYYRALDSSGTVVGYAFFRQQPGAQGIIEIAGGVTSDYAKITGIKIMKNSETPGLGAKIVNPDFTDQFTNIALADLSLSRDGGKVDAITGASISSKAVVDALNSQVEDIKEAEG